MKTQFDFKKRVVSLENLHAMCARISGWSHTFEVSKISRSRVHVTYSNPDEYGNPRPITAVFPCYPATDDQPGIVLDLLRCIGDRDGYGYQSFDPLIACPTLWRSTVDGRDVWETHSEIRNAGNDRGVGAPTAHDPCTVCDLPEEK